MNLSAQILGFFALCCLVVSIQQKTKKTLLRIQVISNILYGFQYLFLNAFSATCMSGVSLLRCLIFYEDSENNKQTSKFVLGMFIVLIIAIGSLTYTDIYSLIPLTITIMYTYAVWQNNMTVFRIISIIVALSWIVYNVNVGAYVAIIGSIIELSSSIIAFIRFDIKKLKIKEKKYIGNF